MPHTLCPPWGSLGSGFSLGRMALYKGQKKAPLQSDGAQRLVNLERDFVSRLLGGLGLRAIAQDHADCVRHLALKLDPTGRQGHLATRPNVRLLSVERGNRIAVGLVQDHGLFGLPEVHHGLFVLLADLLDPHIINRESDLLSLEIRGLEKIAWKELVRFHVFSSTVAVAIPAFPPHAIMARRQLGQFTFSGSEVV